MVENIWKKAKRCLEKTKKKKKKWKECKKIHIHSMSQEELQHHLEQIIEPIENLRGESVIKEIIFKKYLENKKTVTVFILLKKVYFSRNIIRDGWK